MVDVILKPRFLIKSGYDIVPSPSTALLVPLRQKVQNVKLNLMGLLFIVIGGLAALILIFSTFLGSGRISL